MHNNASTKGFFTCFANNAANISGNPYTFLVASGAVIAWAICGPFFGFSDTWQLIINTGTSITTFLMVFLIQNTQNRDSKALQLKMDELIRATEGAHTVLLDLEELNDEELETIRGKYEKIAKLARQRMHKGKSDTDIPDIVLNEEFKLKETRKRSARN